jgi:hypothetical protein
MRHRIGIDNIMVEVDYPHSDSIWPDTQELMRRRFLGVDRDEVDKMTHLNAAYLFRHPVPTEAGLAGAPASVLATP